MPEGDTVWRECRRLNDVLAGRVLTRSEFRVPSLATTDLTGVAVRQVTSRGKHQLFRFGNDYTLHTHFKMDGAWKIYSQGRRWGGGPAFQIRAVLATGDHDVVGYRLPIVELVPTADEDTVVGHLGPDLLGSDWDLDEAVRRINSQPDRRSHPPRRSFRSRRPSSGSIRSSPLKRLPASFRCSSSPRSRRPRSITF